MSMKMCRSHTLQRMDYLNGLMQGIVEIVRTGHGLSHQGHIITFHSEALSSSAANFHECCRALARLKTNYQAWCIKSDFSYLLT